jgi:hypothetical protein
LPLFVAVVEVVAVVIFAQFAHSIPSGFCFYHVVWGLYSLLASSQTAQTKTMPPPS